MISESACIHSYVHTRTGNTDPRPYTPTYTLSH